MYYKIETQQVLSEQEIRNEFPNTSFTVPFQAPKGYAPILETPQPETTTYQSAFKNGVEQDSLGNYVWAWRIVDWTQEQIDAYNEQLKQSNKQQAERLLAESDWTDKPSVTDISKPLHLVNAAEWDTYRDALRMIAVVPTVTVEWPTKPEEVWSIQ
jgi:hypothetical protein